MGHPTEDSALRLQAAGEFLRGSAVVMRKLVRTSGSRRVSMRRFQSKYDSFGWRAARPPMRTRLQTACESSRFGDLAATRRAASSRRVCRHCGSVESLTSSVTLDNGTRSNNCPSSHAQPWFVGDRLERSINTAGGPSRLLLAGWGFSLTPPPSVAPL